MRERAEYTDWLREADESPIAAGERGRLALQWYPYDAGPVYLSRLEVDPASPVVPIVTAAGILVRATALGTIAVGIGGEVVRLRVYRIPNAGREPFYEVHLRDTTNGVATPAAGRFVDLIPMGDHRFLLDLNRARNPWCVYTETVACPTPWPGEHFGVPVPVGEMAPRFSPTTHSR